MPRAMGFRYPAAMSITDDPSPSAVEPPQQQHRASLCVLASGSSGNCSVVKLERGGVTRLALIDLGLSPRRTFRLLSEMGLRPDQIDDCLVTHLDGDHFHAGWRRQMPGQARVWMHDRHARAAAAWGWMSDPWAGGVRAFEGDFALEEDVLVRPLLMPHDELGVSVFRIDLGETFGAGRRVSLGFATDLGRVHAGLTEHFSGCSKGGPARPVDVLAIESNYCPVMQHASGRSEALKRRVMGGHGHLSNQEALSAVLQIEPREHVVLLHLSRDCNDPAVASALHAGADYALTISSRERPTRWVRIGPAVRAGSVAPVAPSRRESVGTGLLWSGV